jgi:hypothetical protein
VQALLQREPPNASRAIASARAGVEEDLDDVLPRNLRPGCDSNRVVGREEAARPIGRRPWRRAGCARVRRRLALRQAVPPVPDGNRSTDARHRDDQRITLEREVRFACGGLLRLALHLSPEMPLVPVEDAAVGGK